MDMLVVHPAYWCRGHGTNLLEWGMKLANLDSVKQGVIATNMGEELCLSKGYKKLDDVVAVDENDCSKKIKLGVLELVPESRPEL